MRFLTVACAIVTACCGSTEQLVNQQQKALTSLKSTVTSIGKSWLDGNVSTTYARTALEAAATLLEKERAKLSASLDALTDPAAASLSDQENQLAQQIASLRKALADSDSAAVRQVISAVGSRPSQLP